MCTRYLQTCVQWQICSACFSNLREMPNQCFQNPTPSAMLTAEVHAVTLVKASISSDGSV